MERFSSGQMGSVIFPAFEGSRVVFTEIQALVGDHNENYPVRTSLGVERNKLLILIAILEKHLHFNLSTKSIYLNIAGGMHITDPSMDMAIIGALLSSVKNLSPENPVAMMGEASLSGDFLANKNLSLKLKTLAQSGVKLAYFSAPAKGEEEVPKNYHQINHIDDLAKQIALWKKPPPK